MFSPKVGFIIPGLLIVRTTPIGSLEFYYMVRIQKEINAKFIEKKKYVLFCRKNSQQIVV